MILQLKDTYRLVLLLIIPIEQKKPKTDRQVWSFSCLTIIKDVPTCIFTITNFLDIMPISKRLSNQMNLSTIIKALKLNTSWQLKQRKLVTILFLYFSMILLYKDYKEESKICLSSWKVKLDTLLLNNILTNPLKFFLFQSSVRFVCIWILLILLLTKELSQLNNWIYKNLK